MIAGVLSVTVPERSSQYASRKTLNVLDPCAGEGEAILELIKSVLAVPNLREAPVDVKLFTCELEETRAKTLRGNVSHEIHYTVGNEALHGDAFRTTFTTKGKYEDNDGVSLLYLNPPYDTDRVHGRLEQRFLDRFSSSLTVDGVLVFVVPFYALEASANLLGLEYSDVRCFKFPEEDYNIYHQVVLYARKGERVFEPNPAIVSKVLGWSRDASTIEEFPGAPLYDLRLDDYGRGGLKEWKIQTIDMTALLAKVQPWMHSKRGGELAPVHGVIPQEPVRDILLRNFPLATPPRPAHIASGIASGLFNGSKIEPTDTSTGLPSLLIKGVFDREFRTVEEKTNKDGETVGYIQIQQPKLVTTVLDLSTHKYHMLKTGVEETGRKTIDSMNVADLLKFYGESLMGVMERQCPVLYDPRRDAESIPIAASPRKPFTAQGHATRAIVKLLGGVKATKRSRRGKAAILLGEIGSGKSTVALLAGRTIGAHRFLIMCPPHLLKSWQNEIGAVVPSATVMVLSTIEDLQALDQIESDSESPLICILSREVGKLSHAWAGVGEVCPKCGQKTPEKVDLAKKRSKCEHKGLVAKDFLARTAQELAAYLSAFVPKEYPIPSVLRGRFDQVRLERYEALHEQGEGRPYSGLGKMSDKLDEVLFTLLGREASEAIDRTIRGILLANWSVTRIASTVRFLLGNRGKREGGLVPHADDFSRSLLLMLPPGHPEQERIMEEFSSESSYFTWSSVKLAIKELSEGRSVKYPFPISWAEGVLKMGTEDTIVNSAKAACNVVAYLVQLGAFRWTDECGEHLFGAIPEPRRVSLAKHIIRYHQNTFDYLVLDEGHEYSTDGSAQERSAHRLTSLQLPTVLMSGSIMNGYAESLFANMWALSADFRMEFSREDRQKFVDRYGYRKRLVEGKDEESKVVEFGSNSDRVTRSERMIGNAPGILPLFLLKHLLPISVTLHKADLAIDLPPCRQQKHVVSPEKDQKDRFEELQNALIERIRKDQFDKDLAGKLFGQLAELPSYLDRATCDVGNVESGDYEIRYPESVGDGLVASQPGMPSDKLLPKEEWMLDLIEKELDEGRNVMVFSWHTALLPRIAKLIQDRFDIAVPILYADKVPTAKRQDWIDREVVRKRRRIMVTNPVCIQTGLNNLVHFASEIWLENPACNPVIFRQAIGRIDRIGQKLETRVHTAIYGDTLQVALYDLLMKKVAVSVSTDGLDPEAALHAAGLGEDNYLAGLSIGKQLWNMIGAMN
jgi:hypothetical protein